MKHLPLLLLALLARAGAKRVRLRRLAIAEELPSAKRARWLRVPQRVWGGPHDIVARLPGGLALRAQQHHQALAAAWDAFTAKLAAATTLAAAECARAGEQAAVRRGWKVGARKPQRKQQAGHLPKCAAGVGVGAIRRQ